MFLRYQKERRLSDVTAFFLPWKRSFLAQFHTCHVQHWTFSTHSIIGLLQDQESPNLLWKLLFGWSCLDDTQDQTKNRPRLNFKWWWLTSPSVLVLPNWLSANVSGNQKEDTSLCHNDQRHVWSEYECWTNTIDQSPWVPLEITSVLWIFSSHQRTIRMIDVWKKSFLFFASRRLLLDPIDGLHWI